MVVPYAFNGQSLSFVFIVGKDDLKEDRFNRSPFAQRIADTISDRRDASSLVIGIYGAWGDGKTSVLRLMEEAFNSQQNVVTINFNPWHFQSESQLLNSFFKTLADGLGKKLSKKVEELGQVLTRYGSLLSLASLSIFGDVAQISPGEGVRELGQTLSTVELEELKKRVELLLRESGKRIVILIDDIDRLDRQEIQSIFKLVKLSAGFENISYVLAFDDEVVAHSLGERYGAGGATAGRSFLEKIIQVPLHLPPADQVTLRQLVFEGIDATLQLNEIELPHEDLQSFVRYFVDGLQIRLQTPRQAKLYANALSFAIPILKGEVHPIDQMLIEGIRIFYPKLYDIIREHPRAFLGRSTRERPDETSRKKSLETIHAGLEGLSNLEQQAAQDLLKVLFPCVEEVLGNTYYGPKQEQRWLKEQRICSDFYFDRYFQYAIPTRDVSDHALRAFLETSITSCDLAIDESIKRFTEDGKASRFMAKLRLEERSVGQPLAKKLALAISRNGLLFPQDRGRLNFYASAFSQAAFFVVNLTQVFPAGPERKHFAEEIITLAVPLPFAMEVFRWFGTGKDESERIISIEFEQELGRILAARIREIADVKPPYKEAPGDAISLLGIWNKYGRVGEVTTYLEARFVAEPQEALGFIISLVPTALDLSSGLSSKTNFRQDRYNTVAELISPELVFECLRSIYGTILDTAEFYPSRECSVEERIALQFAYLHRKAMQSEIKDTPSE
jgi:hypothetical protein